MTLIIAKPTSPGKRGQIRVNRSPLYKGRGYKSLLEPKKKHAGRNNTGKITVRHKGGGERHHYRVIDFKRNKTDIPGTVERIEYDPNRTAYIALICYQDGERRYIIAPKDLKVGDQVISGEQSKIAVGNALPIRNIPVGTLIHCVELKPGKGAQMIRSAGTVCQLVAKEGRYATLRLKSGEMRKVLAICMATIGQVSNTENNLENIGKAGINRHRGIRPTVRGVAMNPVDHPHGGGEGKTAGGRHPVTPWGKPTKGYKTRKNKVSSKYIVRRRNKRKER